MLKFVYFTQFKSLTSLGILAHVECDVKTAARLRLIVERLVENSSQLVDDEIVRALLRCCFAAGDLQFLFERLDDSVDVEWIELGLFDDFVGDLERVADFTGDRQVCLQHFFVTKVVELVENLNESHVRKNQLENFRRFEGEARKMVELVDVILSLENRKHFVRLLASFQVAVLENFLHEGRSLGSSFDLVVALVNCLHDRVLVFVGEFRM